MAISERGLADVERLVKEAWSDVFMEELREQLLLGSLINKDYDGQIAQQGDTVKVSQINAPSGELRTVGVDSSSFSTETISTTQIEVKADKRAVAGYDMEDLALLQSQLGNQDSSIRAALLHAVGKQINDYVYSLVDPSAVAAHDRSGVSDYNISEHQATRTLAAKAKWMNNKGWYGLLSPQYYSDLMSETQLQSRDFRDDSTIISGQIAQDVLGFKVLEDNSIAAAGNLANDDAGIFFHPDFLHMVMQQAPRFKISDKHANKEFGFVMSVDVVFGAKQGIDSAQKHIRVTG